jgi:hypothetical protein
MRLIAANQNNSGQSRAKLIKPAATTLDSSKAVRQNGVVNPTEDSAEPSSAGDNRREWAARRRVNGSPLRDGRGARGRARELRDAVRAGRGEWSAVAAAGLGGEGTQLSLWAAVRR